MDIKHVIEILNLKNITNTIHLKQYRCLVFSQLTETEETILLVEDMDKEERKITTLHYSIKDGYLTGDKILSILSFYQDDIIGEDIENKPYIYKYRVRLQPKYNPKFGDKRVCKCGHIYERHFDPYEKMLAIGCKYCECMYFEEKES